MAVQWPLTTIAPCGIDEVSTAARLDEMSCFTVICTVCYQGDKFPPWMILTGTMQQCEVSYCNDARLPSARGENVCDHPF